MQANTREQVEIADASLGDIQAVSSILELLRMPYDGINDHPAITDLLKTLRVIDPRRSRFLHFLHRMVPMDFLDPYVPLPVTPDAKILAALVGYLAAQDGAHMALYNNNESLDHASIWDMLVSSGSSDESRELIIHSPNVSAVMEEDYEIYILPMRKQDGTKTRILDAYIVRRTHDGNVGRALHFRAGGGGVMRFDTQKTRDDLARETMIADPDARIIRLFPLIVLTKQEIGRKRLSELFELEREYRAYRVAPRIRIIDGLNRKTLAITSAPNLVTTIHGLQHVW